MKEGRSQSVWSVKHCAAELGVNTSFYRRNILPLPGHPTPIDSSKKNWSFWAQEMKTFLGDTQNLKYQAA
jgi:hypothetical protein